MQKGLTLVELVMVLAVLAIIGAILMPNFLSTTGKARLKSDIQSAIVIQNAMELYRSERGAEVTGANAKVIGDGIEDTVLATLASEGYIKGGVFSIQTSGAQWETDENVGVVVNIAGAVDPDSANAAFNQLSDSEKPYVVGEK